MTRLIVLTTPERAQAVLRWAWRLTEARAREEHLLVLTCTPHPSAALTNAVDEGLSELKGLKVERMGLTSEDPTKAILTLIRRRGIQSVVIGSDGMAPPDSLSARIGDRLLASAPCDVILIDPGETDGTVLHEILIPLDTPVEAYALRSAVEIARHLECFVVPLLVRPTVEGEAQEIAQRELEFELREAEIPASPFVKPAIVDAKTKLEGIRARVAESDLVGFGAKTGDPLRALRTGDPDAGIVPLPPKVAVAVFRRELIRRGPVVGRLLGWIPELKPADRVELFESLNRGAQWSPDFVVMMAASAAIASLGLLQDSAAVVIGAMLVAPLMTPLIAAGLALVQGSLAFFRRSLRSMGYGVATALAVSVAIGVLTPQSDLTREIVARSAPNVLDLAVAFLSGVAAAYALARPNILGAMAGVAIAAALVPPLASVGLAFSQGDLHVAEGAAILFVTNLVAIVLGSAGVFHVLGVRETKSEAGAPVWVRRTTMSLVTASVLLLAPLGYELFAQLRIGQARPYYFPVSAAVEQAVAEHVDTIPGLSLVRVVRSGLDRGWDISVVVVSDDPVPREVEFDIRRVVWDELGEQEPQVAVYAYRSGWED